MNKICIVSMSNLYVCPYLQRYLEIINGNCLYDIIYWDRHGIEEKIDANETYIFQQRLEESENKARKLMKFIKYRQFIKKIILNNKYDGIIFLHNNIAILLSGILLKHYNKNYIIDIRDYTMEKNGIYSAIEKKLLDNAAECIISSDGYKAFLPESDYTITHNTFNIDSDIKQKFRNRLRKNEDKINISFIGLVRFFDQNKKIIENFGNDKRFILNYYGKNAYKLEKYIGSNKYSNINYIDRFEPSETIKFYQSADIINNAYGNKAMSLDYALSNKLYYASNLGLPILVSPDTYMERISLEYGFGYTLDIEDPNMCDSLYNYYKSINWDEFYAGCDLFTKKVEEDEQNFKNTILNFIQRQR